MSTDPWAVSDPQPPFESRRSGLTAKPCLVAFCIHEAAARGLRDSGRSFLYAEVRSRAPRSTCFTLVQLQRAVHGRKGDWSTASKLPRKASVCANASPKLTIRKNLWEEPL